MARDLARTVNGVPERFIRAQMRGQLVEAEHLARYWWSSELVAGKSVLDAGCGTAYGAVLMAEAGAREVVGVDIADDVLRAASELHDAVRLVRADVRELPFEDASFDVIVCFEVIEHLDNPLTALDEFARVVRDGGFALLSSPNRFVYPPGNPHHKHEFVPAELREALEARFARVDLYRQDDWVTSAILDGEGFCNGDDSVVADTVVRKVVPAEADSELYTLAIAGNSELPQPSRQAVLTKAVDIRDLIADLQSRQRALDELRSIRDRLEHTVSDQERHLDALRYRIERMAERQRELRRLLLEAHEQLLRRDEELLAGFRREIEPRDEEIAWLREVVADHEQQLEGLAASRLWRMCGRYWRIRDAVKSALPGRPDL